MTTATAQRNIEGILRILPEVEELIKVAKETGNSRHEVAQSGYLMSLNRQLSQYREALK